MEMGYSEATKDDTTFVRYIAMDAENSCVYDLWNCSSSLIIKSYQAFHGCSWHTTIEGFFHVKSHQNHAFITTMMSPLLFEMSAHAATLCDDELQTR